MTTKADKQRIVALQKALRIARHAIERARWERLVDADDVLDRINQFDWHSKPTALAPIVGHARPRP